MYPWLSRIMLLVFAFQIFTPQPIFASSARKVAYNSVRRGIAEGKARDWQNKVKELEGEFLSWRRMMLQNAGFNLNDPADREDFELLEAPQLRQLQYLKLLWFDRIFFDGRHTGLWESYHNPDIRYTQQGENEVISETSVCSLYNAIKNLHTESSWIETAEKEMQKLQNLTATPNASADNTRITISAVRKTIQTAPKSALIQMIESGIVTLDELTEELDPWQTNKQTSESIIIAAEIWGNTLDNFSRHFGNLAGEEDNEEWNGELAKREFDLQLLKLQLHAIHRLTQLKPLSYKSDLSSIEQAGALQILLLKIRNFYQAQQRPNPLASKRFSCGIDNTGAGSYGTATVSGLFYDQIKKFSGTSYEDNTAEYQQFLMLLDYAISYEIANNFMGNIEEYVKLLDKPLKRNKYQQRNSSILEYLFLNWYENIRYNNNNQTPDLKDIIAKFSQFTDEQYALPTRIFALEVISALFRQQNGDAIKMYQREMWKQVVPQSFSNYEFPDLLRKTAARKVSEIYCPLTYTGNYTMEDYGLDSSQMQLLANKLAQIYNNFYDITTTLVSAPGAPVRSPESDCYITARTPINMQKKQREINNKILNFTAEAIFWVYGGEIFTFIGRAFRIARGAAFALPKALKASAMAKRGRRGMTFAVEMEKSRRMSTLSKNLTRNGVNVNATRVTTNAASNIVKPLTSNHALANKYSLWNPRRWIGQEPGQVLEYQITQQTPGLGLNIGRVSGAKLPNGIRSYQDWRIFRNNLTDMGGNRMTLNTYSFAEQELLKSEAFSLKSVDKMSKSGAFDLWVPGENGTYYSLRGFFPEESVQPFFKYPKVKPAAEPFIALANPKGPAILTSLHNVPGMRISYLDLELGTWKSKVANELYTQVDWGGPVSNLIMPRYIPKHVSLLEAPGRMLMNTFKSASLPHGIASTTKFFLGMEGLDRVVFPYYKNWMTSSAEEVEKELIASHGKTLDPKLMAKDEKAEQEILAELKKQGFNTDPVNPMYDEILGAAKDEKSGAAISWPLIAGIHYSSKLPFTFWKSPFESEGQRIAIDRQARQRERARIMRRYSQAVQEQNQRELERLDKEQKIFIQKQLELLAEEKQNMLAMFTQLEQDLPGDWSAEKTKFSRFYASSEAELRKAAQIEDLNTRINRVNSIDSKYEAKTNELFAMITKKKNKLLLAAVAPEGEKAFWEKHVQLIQTNKENTIYTIDSLPIDPDICNKFLTQYTALTDETLAKIKALSKQKTDFLSRYNTLQTILKDFNQKEKALEQEILPYIQSGQESFSDVYFHIKNYLNIPG